MIKIALLNFGGIGDEILFSPVPLALRKHMPDTEITLFLESRSVSVSALVPEINRTIPVPTVQNRLYLFVWLLKQLRCGQFDVVISSGSTPYIALLLGASGIPVRVGFKTGRWTDAGLSHPALLNRSCYAAAMYFSLADTYLRSRQTGYEPMEPVIPRLTTGNHHLPDGLASRCQMSPKAGGRRILIHPGVSRMSVDKGILKGWSIDHWCGLILRLLSAGHIIWLCGGPDDDAVINGISEKLFYQSGWLNLTGLTQSLLDLAGLIRMADLLVSVDSAPMHLAVGLGKPLVAMFGPTDPTLLLPQDPRFRAVTQSSLTCRPCLWAKRQTSCDNPVCLDVSVDAMVSAIHETLACVEQVSP